MLHCLSLALSVSRLDFVIDFVSFSLLLPTGLLSLNSLFPSIFDLMVVLLLLLILFPDGFLLCDHGLDF